MRDSRAAEDGSNPGAKMRRQFVLEPRVATQPYSTAPRGMRQWDHCGTIRAPRCDGRGHRAPWGMLQRPPLSVSAHQKRQLHSRQARQKRPSPERGASGRWRIVAAFGIGPRKAERHRGHANMWVPIEGAAIQSKPLPQPVTGGVVERQSAFMHASTWRLAADQEPGLGGYLHHRAGFMAEFPSTCATGANVREQRVELRIFRASACFAAPQVEVICSNVHQIVPFL